MVEAQCYVHYAFLLSQRIKKMMEDIHFIIFLSNLLEAKIIRVLRSNHEQLLRRRITGGLIGYCTTINLESIMGILVLLLWFKMTVTQMLGNNNRESYPVTGKTRIESLTR